MALSTLIEDTTDKKVNLSIVIPALYQLSYLGWKQVLWQAGIPTLPNPTPQHPGDEVDEVHEEAAFLRPDKYSKQSI